MPENNPGTTETLTPSQRLEQSRRALLEMMRPGATASLKAARQAAEGATVQAQMPDAPSPVVAQAPSFVTAAATGPVPPTTADVEAAAASDALARELPPRTPRVARRPARAWSLSGLVDSDTGRALSTGALAAQRLLNAWWRRHPMHMVLEVGEPVLQQYARRRPYQLLALSAAAGALIVLARPWRWNSTQRMVRNSVRRELSGWDLRSLTQLALDSLLATLRTAPRKD